MDLYVRANFFMQFFLLPVFVLTLTETCSSLHACRLEILAFLSSDLGPQRYQYKSYSDVSHSEQAILYTDFIITFRSFVAGCKLLVVSSGLVLWWSTADWWPLTADCILSKLLSAEWIVRSGPVVN